VYFAANLSEGQSITGKSGTDAGKVTIVANGSEEDGSTASAALAVFKVDTQALQFEGGPRAFAFTVAEDGQEDKTVTVDLTVDVESGLTGVAVFKVLSDLTPVVANGSAGIVGDEILERLDAKQINADGSPINDEDGNQLPAVTLFDAIKWVDQNAEANTEYLIRVEENEAMDRIILTCNQASNVTLRLRGYGDDAWEISCNSDVLSSGSVSGLYINSKKMKAATIGNAFSNAFINVGEFNSGTSINNWGSITLQLEKNITIKGFTAPSVSGATYHLMAVNPKHTLVMLDGSTITGYRSSGSGNQLVRMNNKAEAASFSMYTGAKIIGNENAYSSSGKVRFIWFLLGGKGNFYKAQGADVKDNTDSSNGNGNCVAFDSAGSNFDISDSTRSYTYDPESKEMK
jgi:hypothetical protein